MFGHVIENVIFILWVLNSHKTFLTSLSPKFVRKYSSSKKIKRSEFFYEN